MRSAVHRSWALTVDVRARTQPGLDAAFEKLQAEVDPEHKCSDAERVRRAKHLQKAKMLDLSRLASQARRAKAARRTGES